VISRSSSQPTSHFVMFSWDPPTLERDAVTSNLEG